MSNNDQLVLDALFRDIVKFYSSSQTSIITLNAITAAITELECPTEDFKMELTTVCDIIKNSQPRMFPIDNLIILLEKELQEKDYFSDKDIDARKTAVTKIIESLEERLNDDMNELANQGVKHIEDGDHIILHSVEEGAELLLPEAKRMGKNFEVLILRQDLVKTKQVINILDTAGIKYTVVPEWDLIHFFDKVNKLFIGAYALTVDGKFVSDSGTSNIVSECHIHKLPVYLFAPTLEITNTFSRDQNIYLKDESVNESGSDYNLISHSSDIVSLDLVDHIITEHGAIDKSKLADYCTT
jgi:translation initiation factor 2B subunit (eIF-2B alpha/beta/delta family)|tara:strand:+ start:942 stop:1838 length:897 start_codon:yes stop_codon:yes gene_type:complete